MRLSKNLSLSVYFSRGKCCRSLIFCKSKGKKLDSNTNAGFEDIPKITSAAPERGLI